MSYLYFQLDSVFIYVSCSQYETFNALNSDSTYLYFCFNWACIWFVLCNWSWKSWLLCCNCHTLCSYTFNLCHASLSYCFLFSSFHHICCCHFITSHWSYNELPKSGPELLPEEILFYFQGGFHQTVSPSNRFLSAFELVLFLSPSLSSLLLLLFLLRWRTRSRSRRWWRRR